MPGWKTHSCFRHATGVGIDVPVQHCLSSVGVRLVCFATQSRCAFGSSRKPKPCPHVVYMSSTCRLRREVKKISLEQSTCRRAQDVEQQLQYQELISSNCPSWIQLALSFHEGHMGPSKIMENHQRFQASLLVFVSRWCGLNKIYKCCPWPKSARLCLIRSAFLSTLSPWTMVFSWSFRIIYLWLFMQFYWYNNCEFSTARKRSETILEDMTKVATLNKFRRHYSWLSIIHQRLTQPR